jgi:hypothetical protein
METNLKQMVRALNRGRKKKPRTYVTNCTSDEMREKRDFRAAKHVNAGLNQVQFRITEKTKRQLCGLAANRLLDSWLKAVTDLESLLNQQITEHPRNKCPWKSELMWKMNKDSETMKITLDLNFQSAQSIRVRACVCWGPNLNWFLSLR